MSPNSTPNEVAFQFLTEIFEPEGEPLTNARIAIWNKANHRTHLAADPEEAARLIEEDDWQNVSYFGVCPRDEAALRKKAREAQKPLSNFQGERTELVSMPGVWVDIDVVASGHRKLNLAPSIDLAIEALRRAVPIEPTITVRTGGGIHAYWLFGEGVIDFGAPGSERAREPLEMLCRSFQAMVRDELKKREWADDQTWSLPRVMRIPGGSNVSHGRPIPVTWEKTGRRYSLDELWMVVPADLELAEPSKISPHDERVQFDLTPLTDGQVAATEHYAAEVSDIDPEFRKVWDRKRPSMTSQSDFDMSLSTRLAAADTPAQRIVDVLRVHRLQADAADRKVFRSDYYLRTLLKAYASSDGDRRREKVVEDIGELKHREQIAKEALVRAQVAADAIPATPEGSGSSSAQSPADGDSGARPGDGDAASTAAAEETAAARALAHEAELLAQAELEQIQEEQERVWSEARSLINEALELTGPNEILRVIQDESATVGQEIWTVEFRSGVSRAMKLSQLFTPAAMEQAILSATGQLVKPFSRKPGQPRQWKPVLQALQAISVKFGEGDELEQVLRSLIRMIVEYLGRDSMNHAKPGSPPWHQGVSTRTAVMLFEPSGRSKLGKGLLVQASEWVAFAQFDPHMKAPAGEMKNLVRQASKREPRITSPYKANFQRADQSWSTQGGYVVVGLDFFRRFGADAELADVEHHFQTAVSE